MSAKLNLIHLNIISYRQQRAEYLHILLNYAKYATPAELTTAKKRLDDVTRGLKCIVGLCVHQWSGYGSCIICFAKAAPESKEPIDLTGESADVQASVPLAPIKVKPEVPCTHVWMNDRCTKCQSERARMVITD